MPSSFSTSDFTIFKFPFIKVPFKNGRLSYTPPEAGSIPNERKRKKKAESVNAKEKGQSPKGSKNKKTLEREAALETQSTRPKRGPGRPKGSKNKKTLEREAREAATGKQAKRGPGRPKGSKNKKTLEREALAAKQLSE